MRGKWAAGIPPRNFTWIVKDQLAVSERPGGSAPSHRRVRRQEEIIWLRVQGFSRVISLLPSPHNLAAYDDGGLRSSHFAFPGADVEVTLRDLYRELDARLGAGERLLVHQEELGERIMGVIAGYLLWSGRLPGAPQAIAVVERLVGHQMGSPGRDVIAVVATLDPHGPGGRPPSERPTAADEPPGATTEGGVAEDTTTGSAPAEGSVPGAPATEGTTRGGQAPGPATGQGPAERPPSDDATVEGASVESVKGNGANVEDTRDRSVSDERVTLEAVTVDDAPAVRPTPSTPETVPPDAAADPEVVGGAGER